jgi:hypothetical protein
MSFNDIINNNNYNNTNNTTNNTTPIVSNNLQTNNTQQAANKVKKEQACKDDAVNVSIKSCKNITSKQALLIIPITKYFSNKKTLKKLITILKGESISLRLIDWFVTNYCKKFNVLYNLNDFIEKEKEKEIILPLDIQQSHQAQQQAQEAQQQAQQAQEAQDQKDKSFDNFIIVHNNYKGQLKAYSKKNFDPFCRRNRIRFYYDENKYFITTVGQLNFFKWALENYIINYIKAHLKDIENDMNLRCEIVKKVSTKIKNQENENTAMNEIILKTKKSGITTRKKRKEISAAASKTLSIHNLPMTIEFD